MQLQHAQRTHGTNGVASAQQQSYESPTAVTNIYILRCLERFHN
jgi:hypothetical protein